MLVLLDKVAKWQSGKVADKSGAQSWNFSALPVLELNKTRNKPLYVKYNDLFFFLLGS